MWISDGVMIHALPAIVANLIVSGLALYSAWRTLKFHEWGPESPM